MKDTDNIKKQEGIMKDTDNIKYLLKPTSIAILGCSETNRGGITMSNLLRAGYAGKLFPVHPKHKTVFDFPCYQNLTDIPEPVDCCIVALRSTRILDSIEEMHQKGVKAAVIFASGFAELGAEGRAIQAEISVKLKEYGIAACGPNCLGLINWHERIPLYSASLNMVGKPGAVGVIAHSGSACIAITSAGRGIGFSYVISCGNEAGISVADYCEAMINEDRTQVIVAYLEALRDPASLARAAALARKANKPIIVLRVGKSKVGQKTAAAHSGALASSSTVIDAFFKKHHILTADSFDELFEMCEIFLKLKDHLPAGKEIALTAISGGQLGFSSDVAEAVGIPFAQVSPQTIATIKALLPDYANASNPLDVTTALFEPPVYKACVQALAQDEAVSMVVVCQDCESHLGQRQVTLYQGIFNALGEAAQDISKPLVVFSPMSGGLQQELRAALDKTGTPLLMGAHESMKAVGALLQWAQWQNEPQNEEEIISAPIPLEFGKNKNLSESQSKGVLAAYGIPVAKDAMVQSEDEAVQAAAEIGYPVVIKVDSPDIPHKTEAGVVRLNLSNETELRQGYRQIMANAAAYNPEARIQGVSLQEMVLGGVEILLGAKNDPVFGPAVMVGLGGIFVEIFKDFSLRLAPIDLPTAYEMIDSLKGAPLLKGARGAKPADISALADALVRLGQLAYDHRDTISEIDINPVKVLEDGKGIRAVDALVIQNSQ